MSKKVVLAIGYLLLLVGLTGCASFQEGVKGLTGVSTKVLEEGRKDAVVKTFNFGFETCYSKTKDALRQIGAYIYAEDKYSKMIAIYVSEEDTTPVGLFFSEVDTDNTKIEFSSPSSYSKEYIALEIAGILTENGEQKIE